MDCRLDDTTVVPLLCRVEYARPKEWDAESEHGLWPHDDAGRALAYTVAERDAIVAELDAAKIVYRVAAEGQPDPVVLAALQGRATSRTEALALLASGKVPPTIDEIVERVKELEARPIAAERVL